MLRDFANRLDMFSERIAEFLAQENSLGLATSAYADDPAEIASVSFLTNYLKEASDAMKRFGRNTTFDRLALYGEDGRLLVVYLREDGQESVGVYIMSEAGNDTYLPLDDFAQLSPIHVSRSF